MLLAVDTASRWLSIALHDGEHILAEHTVQSNNRHTVQLAAAVDHTLRESGFSAAALTMLAIAQGPGSFSGLRVGFGFMKGLAAARNLPLIPVPTLHILAAGTPYFDGVLVAVMQAGRRRILAGFYHWADNRWQEQQAPVNTTWQDLLATLSARTLVNGEVDTSGRELVTEAGQVFLAEGWQMRRAGFLAQLAWEKYRRGDFNPDAAQVNPVYLREP